MLGFSAQEPVDSAFGLGPLLIQGEPHLEVKGSNAIPLDAPGPNGAY
jgi:hypothetical protein